LQSPFVEHLLFGAFLETNSIFLFFVSGSSSSYATTTPIEPSQVVGAA
jgi:hypothetical protein